MACDRNRSNGDCAKNIVVFQEYTLTVAAEFVDVSEVRAVCKDDDAQ